MDFLPHLIDVVFIASVCTVLIWWTVCLKTLNLMVYEQTLLVSLPVALALSTGLLSHLGWFLENTVPPRILLPVGAAVVLIGFLWMKGYLQKLSRLSYWKLIIVSGIRLPVEWVLHQLNLVGGVPESMTWSGYNFDWLSGLLALVVVFLLKVTILPKVWLHRLIVVFTWLGFILLVAIVVQAFLSVPGPLHFINKQMPNVAVLRFPFILLPTIIVPLVLLSHLVLIRKLLDKSPQS